MYEVFPMGVLKMTGLICCNNYVCVQTILYFCFSLCI